MNKVSIYVLLVVAMSDMKDDKNNVDAPVVLATEFCSEHQKQKSCTTLLNDLTNLSSQWHLLQNSIANTKNGNHAQTLLNDLSNLLNQWLWNLVMNQKWKSYTTLLNDLGTLSNL